MKNRFRSRAVAFAVASSLSVFASACSDAPQADDKGWDWSGPVGSLGLQLQLAPDIVLSSIEYEITGQGFSPRTGSILVPGTGTTFTATITEIPAGSGHLIKLRSVAAGDAGLACAGQATFDVTANATTQVGVVLSCDGLDVGGSATINGSFNICPSVTSTTLSPTVQAIGGTIAVSLSARDVDMAPQPLSYAWTTNSGTLSNATTTTPSLLCTQPGPVALTYTVRDGACVKTGTLNASCSNSTFDGGVPADGGTDAGGDAGTDAGPGPSNPANVVINEVESNGGTPGDWVELYNKGAQAVDISSWVVRDNNDSNNSFTIPAGTVIQPGAYYVADVDPVFGLGAMDSARLYTANAATLLETYSWTAHAAGTYGRCPNGLGAFVDGASTRGTANTCATSTDAGVTDAGNEFAWAGSNTVTEVDAPNSWIENLSGLAYQAGTPNVLWAVLNNPSKLFKLIPSGSLWVNSAGEWSAGKTLVYPSGGGVPDSEGVTIGLGGALYVATERDNAVGTSKLSVLQFFDAAGTTLTATREWNLTADLPAVGANLGLEAIAFIPDSELAEQSFKEDTGTAYDQARYAQNGGGVFAVGIEGGGAVVIYALDHGAAGGFTKLATLASGFGGVMELAYDPVTNYLWAWTDNTYGNKAALYEIEQSMVSSSYGKFVRRKVMTRPTGLPDSNNEGFTFAPDAQCTGGFRAAFWADDSNANMHALRQGSLTCGKSY